jgi:hypothetical protein
VDEARWAASTDPETMLDFLHHSGKGGGRKLRLFAAACCRRIWHLLGDERSRRAVELLERVADGSPSPEDVGIILAARDAAWVDADKWPTSACAAAHAAAALVTAPAGSSLEFDTVVSVVLEAQFAPREALDVNASCEVGLEVERRESVAQADVLRDMVGNPFRPLPPMPPSLLAWNGGVVRRLAVSIYDERDLAAGTLDAARLRILADALEEAGCTDADIPGHLRGPGAHWRGCWALDAILGKT